MARQPRFGPFGATVTSLGAVASASFDAEAQLRHRIGQITAEHDYLRTSLLGMGIRSAGIRSAGTLANFVCLPAKGQLWKEVFDRTGPRLRTYADCGVRITVGNRQSTQAVLGTIAAAPILQAP